jgi:hypothetical protein
MMNLRILQNKYSILIFICVVSTFYAVNAQDTKPKIVLDKTKQNDKIFKPNYKVYHPSYPNLVAVLRNKFLCFTLGKLYYLCRVDNNQKHRKITFYRTTSKTSLTNNLKK